MSLDDSLYLGDMFDVDLEKIRHIVIGYPLLSVRVNDQGDKWPPILRYAFLWHPPSPAPTPWTGRLALLGPFLMLLLIERLARLSQQEDATENDLSAHMEDILQIVKLSIRPFSLTFSVLHQRLSC